MSLVREHVTDYHQKWSEVRKKVESDIRYQVVESNEERESLFKGFIKTFKSEMKKKKKREKKEAAALNNSSSSKKELRDENVSEEEEGESNLILVRPKTWL